MKSIVIFGKKTISKLVASFSKIELMISLVKAIMGHGNGKG